MLHFKYIFSFLFCLQLLIVQAENYTTEIKPSENNITKTSHSLLASKGSRYQWYLNTLKIEGATTQELEVSSAGIYKLEMTDLDGNIFEKQTIVGLTASGAVIRIFTIGDSTVQDYTAGYYPRKGWGQVLPIFFNTANVSVTNKAVGGTSSKSFYNNFWPAVRDGLQPGDFVFIQFGINDRNSADPARYTPTGGEFESYLTKYINETKAKGAFPVLVATLRRNAWNANGTVYDAYHDHPIATRTVAKSLGVPLIDLDAKAKVLLESVGQTYSTRLLYNNYVAGEYPNYPTGNADDVHFQEMGAIEMAKLVTQGIRELSADPNVSKLIPFLKPEYQIAVSVNPAGADSVTTHTTTYPQGLTITLKTIPKTKSAFQKWNTAASAQLSTAKMTTVTSGTAATSYTAIYAGSTACTATITAPAATTFCSGGSVVFTATAGSSYKWFNGTTQVGTAATYTATAAGSYTVEITNASGCKATSTAKVVTVNPLPVITQYVKIDTGAWLTAATASACETNTVNLGPQPNVAAGWNWTGPNNFTSTLRNPVLSNIVVANAGNYIATYTDANGCKASSTFILQITKPTATITAPVTTFCPGGSVFLTSNTGTSYKWFNGTTQVGSAATYTVATAGSYTVEVTNASGCKATSAPAIITVSAAQQTPTITSSSTSFCPGESVLLTTSTGTSYKWFNGTTQVGSAATYTVATAGSYTVEVTNASGCKATSAPITITVSAAQQTPTITFSSASFCTGKSVLLTANAGASYKWFNGTTTQVGSAATYTATAAGSYTVEVTNASGCKATSAPITITESILSTPTISSPLTSFCTGRSTLLSTNAGSGLTYQWSNAYGKITSATNATYTAVASGTYVVTVTNNNSCSATSTGIQINVTSGTIWYADVDKDGKGDPAVSQTACTQPTGYVSAAGDACPADPSKLTAGACGCGNSETDTDVDSIPDCIDTDNDNDGTPDTNDCAPLNASIGAAGIWYEDTDNDGSGDASSILNACIQPSGYVSVAGDLCPTNPDKKIPGNCGCDKPETFCITTATVNSAIANIVVMPQPFDFNTTIIAENAGTIQSITIISASGTIAESIQGLNISTISIGESLSRGLYSVIIQTNKGIYTTRIVKK